MKRLFFVLVLMALAIPAFSARVWYNVGTNTPSTRASSLGEVFVNGDDIYVLFADQANQNKMVVKKCSDLTNWVTLGVAGFSAATFDSPTLQFPYVGFVDYRNRATVTFGEYITNTNVTTRTLTNYYSNYVLTNKLTVTYTKITNIFYPKTNVYDNYVIDLLTNTVIVNAARVTNTIAGVTTESSNLAGLTVVNTITNVYATGKTNIFNSRIVIGATYIYVTNQVQNGIGFSFRVTNAADTYVNIFTNLIMEVASTNTNVVTNVFAAGITNINTNFFFVTPFNLTFSVLNSAANTVIYSNTNGVYNIYFTNRFYTFTNASVTTNAWFLQTNILTPRGVGEVAWLIGTNGNKYFASSYLGNSGRLFWSTLTNVNGSWKNIATNLSGAYASYLKVFGIDETNMFIVYQDGANGRLGMYVVTNTNGTLRFATNSTFTTRAFNIDATYFDGKPYIIYQTSIPGNIRLVTWTNGVWYSLTNFGYRATEPSVTVDTNGAVYVSYADQTNGGKLVVLQWHTNTIVSLGVLSTGRVTRTKLFADGDTNVGVAYIENQKVKVKVYR